MILIDALTQDISIYSDLLNYGVLGIFSAIMILSIKYLVKEYKKQGDAAIDSYLKQIEQITEDRNNAITEKEELVDKYFNHLASNEGKLIEIINSNSNAFNKVSESNEAVAKAIVMLVKNLEK